MTKSETGDNSEPKPRPRRASKKTKNAALMEKLEAMGVASKGAPSTPQDDRLQHWWSPRFMALPLVIVIVIGVLLFITDRPATQDASRQELALGGTGTSPYSPGRPAPGQSRGRQSPAAPNWRPVSPLVRPPAMRPAPGASSRPPGTTSKSTSVPSGQRPVPPAPYYFQYPRNPVPYQRYTPYPAPYASPPPGYGPYPYGYYPPPRYYSPPQ